MLSALVAIEHGIKGHVGTSSAASAASTVAIGEAYRLIKMDIWIEYLLVDLIITAIKMCLEVWIVLAH